MRPRVHPPAYKFSKPTDFAFSERSCTKLYAKCTVGSLVLDSAVSHIHIQHNLLAFIFHFRCSLTVSSAKIFKIRIFTPKLPTMGSVLVPQPHPSPRIISGSVPDTRIYNVVNSYCCYSCRYYSRIQ